MLSFIRRLLHTARLLASPTQRRYIWRWIASLQPDYFLIHRQPWLTFGAIDALQSYDLCGKKVFEYGSGGSTLFWLDKQASCVSIEHDRAWYNRLKSIVELERYNDLMLDYRLIEPDIEPKDAEAHRDFSDPDEYISAEYTTSKCNYQRYARQIDMFEDDFFDLVLIDGRARPSCIKHSASKVKLGGKLILDNSDRAYYMRKTAQFLRHFDCEVFSGVVPGVPLMSMTSIYTRKR